jgi:hypothetical protein
MEANATPTSDGNGQQASTRRKPNSPKAPGLSLRAAVAEVSKIYQTYTHGDFDRGEMASALGMSANSGSYMSKIATLREYGLIDEVGGRFRVSELFRSIYQGDAGSSELRRNALQAIRSASLFGRLLQQSPNKVLDQDALAMRLERQERFNPERAQQVAAAFRSSLADYGLIDGHGNVLPVRDEPAAPRPDADPADEDAAEEPALPLPKGQETFRVEVPLADDRLAVVALPREVRPGDIKRICAVLTAYTAEVE